MIKACKTMVITKLRHGALITLTVITTIAFLMFFNLFDASAQYLAYWSEQKKIPAYEIYNNEQPPYLIADKNHKVYAFNSQFIGDVDTSDSQKAVFYREWTFANGWTYPNDILADIDGSLELLNLSGDEAGRVHLIFQKNARDVYYSQASLASASKPENWSAAVQVGESSLRITPGIANIAAIATDADGKKLVVIYSGSQYGNGLYFTYSADYGDSWSVSYPLYLTGDSTMIVTNPVLYTGQSGIVHAVWSTFDQNGFGGPGYYAKFDLNLGVWSEPIELDSTGIRTPSVIEYQGAVYVAYYHFSTNSKWWTRSHDDGETWSTPLQFAPQHVGTNGGVSFVVDGDGALHAFFGARIDDNSHGMWHSMWDGATWRIPDAIVQGPGMEDVDGGDRNFDPTYARAVISNGNVALVSWGTDGAAGITQAWYSYKVLDASELPAVSFSTPVVAGVETRLIPGNELTVIPSAVSITVLPDDLKQQDSVYINNPQNQIFIGVFFAALFIVVFIVRFFYTKDK